MSTSQCTVNGWCFDGWGQICQSWRGAKSHQRDHPQTSCQRGTGSCWWTLNGSWSSPATLRADTVLVSETRRCPGFYESTQTSRAVGVGGPLGRSLGRRKLSKYAALVRNCQQAGRKARFLPVEVGRRGICGPLSGRSLQYFRCQRREKRRGGPLAAPLKQRRERLKMVVAQEKRHLDTSEIWSTAAGSPGGGCMMLKDLNAWWFQEYQCECLRQRMYIHTFQTSLRCYTCHYLVFGILFRIFYRANDDCCTLPLLLFSHQLLFFGFYLNFYTFLRPRFVKGFFYALYLFTPAWKQSMPFSARKKTESIHI